MRIRVAVLLLASLSACASRSKDGSQSSSSLPTPARSATKAYSNFIGEYMDWLAASNPVRATQLGFHEHDAHLQDVTPVSLKRRAEALRGWLTRLEQVNCPNLSGDEALDAEMLRNAIRSELLTLEEERIWERNPSAYVGIISGGLSSLSTRDFSPLAERMRDMRSRMARIPSVLEAAKTNLKDVPPLWAQQAIRDARGTQTFLRVDLPRALQAQGVDKVPVPEVEAFNAAREEALTQLQGFTAWLEKDLLPRAHGDFRLGRELFEKKLSLEEHISLNADQLRDINERAIAQYKAWVAREAAKVDPTQSPEVVMALLAKDHPASEELIPLARTQLAELQRFVREKDILTLPTDALPSVRETPPYERLGFASMDTPGPFEGKAKEAYFNITNVEPEWTPEEKAQHLTYFNRAGLLGITVHEAMPGHYVQLLYGARIPTDVRRVYAPASVVEGWAHYAEQMMVDEGLGQGDPAVRLGQLRRALQRHARWYAALALHVYNEPVEAVAKRFAEIAYFEPFPALREVERGTSNPTYLYYALGRMQILKLREDYRKSLEAKGKKFVLKDFHDRFLQLGLPVSLARKVLIPGDEAPSLE
ncbi:DUF885 domain-containing protein [Myxococcus landrumensis]|uniref:DUF885 domain-containing protein n=1 Tax=Myxococcus landrumensis TaxID=2813577 RepID=A0ABX7MZD0_9BACT|nr:DUF885 domain-containing protein [Myxococcus landrumus]QSQ11786.1 DUF885 domain-containing protein [Myxococcus landrumus]